MGQQSEPGLSIHNAIEALNAKLSPADRDDAFRILQGDALTAFLSLPSYCTDGAHPDAQFLAEARSLIALHTSGRKSATPGIRRASIGIEIGAGSAKLIVKLWGGDDGARGKTIADVKLRLPKYVRSASSVENYTICANAIIETFTANIATDEWLVPSQNFDFGNPARLLRGCPRAADFVYVYGTQGPREVSRISGASLSPMMHILSGDEEGRLIFEAIVPDSGKFRPGTMAIEIGSGSTEIILVGMDSEKYPITFSVGAKDESGLSELCRALAEVNLDDEARVYLESTDEAAQSFMRALEGAAPRRLFMNPSRNSDAFRKSVRNGDVAPLETGAVIAYGKAMPGDSYAGKARILGQVARTLGVAQIHEGMRGGLKEAMARFVGAALAETPA